MSQQLFNKFYVKSGDNSRIVLAASPLDAAILCVSAWKNKKTKLSSSVRVSEIGFDLSGLGHEDDIVIPTNFVKSKIRS